MPSLGTSHAGSRRLWIAAVAAVSLALTAALFAQQRGSAPAGAPAPAAKAPEGPLPPGTYATFATENGSFVVQLYADKAPKTVQNFVDLAEGKRPYKDPITGTLSMGTPFYNGLLFFRTIPGYLIQTGDPTNTGRGSIGITVPNESNNLKFDQPGRMSMAQTDEGMRSAQIFFVLKPAAVLDGKFIVMGQIVRGLDVADAISQGPHHGADNDTPDRPVKITRVTVQQAK